MPVIGVPGGAPVRLVPEWPRFCRFGKMVAVGSIAALHWRESREMSPRKLDELIYLEPGDDTSASWGAGGR